MKKFNRTVASLLAIGLFLIGLPLTAQAAAPQFLVTPDSLREKVLTDNFNILQTLNQLNQAKEVVNKDRANLLPSLNLGASGNQGSFILSSMSVLLPFLLPSRWFTYAQDQSLLKAEESAYYVTELNTYAQAFTLYTTVLAYQEIRDIYEQEYQDYKQIEDLQHEAFEMRTIPLHDLLQARAAASKAQYLLSLWDEKAKASLASLRARHRTHFSTY